MCLAKYNMVNALAVCRKSYYSTASMLCPYCGNPCNKSRQNRVTVHSVNSNICTETAKQRFRAGCPSDYSNRFGLSRKKRVKNHLAQI